jgi:hypothetical protein
MKLASGTGLVVGRDEVGEFVGFLEGGGVGALVGYKETKENGLVSPLSIYHG